MKKIIFCLLIMAFSAATVAAETGNPEYKSVVREGAKWFYVTNPTRHTPEVPGCVFLLEFKGDTTINGIRYSKQYTTYRPDDSATAVTYLRNMVRQEGGRVYALMSDDPNVNLLERGIADCVPGPYYDKTGEYQIYDFEDPEHFYRKLERNESGKDGFMYAFEVAPEGYIGNGFPYDIKVDMQENNGFEHRTTTMYRTDDYLPGVMMTFIEGIGLAYCEEGIGCYGWANHWGIGHGWIGRVENLQVNEGLLYFVNENGELEFRNEELECADDYLILEDYNYLMEAINKPSGVTDVKVTNPTDDNYYNLMGQPVAHPEDAPGIYIHEGKKVKF